MSRAVSDMVIFNLRTYAGESISMANTEKEVVNVAFGKIAAFHAGV
jgi:hypothetical protein